MQMFRVLEGEDNQCASSSELFPLGRDRGARPLVSVAELISGSLRKARYVRHVLCI